MRPKTENLIWNVVLWLLMVAAAVVGGANCGALCTAIQVEEEQHL